MMGLVLDSFKMLTERPPASCIHGYGPQKEVSARNTGPLIYCVTSNEATCLFQKL